MQAVVAGLASTEFKTERNRGQSYECRIANAAWPEGYEVWFSVKEQHPAIWIPTTASCANAANLGLTEEASSLEGHKLLAFNDVESGAAQFTPAIQIRLRAALQGITFPDISPKTDF
jgi:hypothetical protein